MKDLNDWNDDIADIIIEWKHFIIGLLTSLNGYIDGRHFW